MKVGFITFENFHGRPAGSIGSSKIRAKWLVEKWEDARLWEVGQKNDVLIFQKVYWPQMIDDFKGVKILDLCDPDWLNGDVNIVETMNKVDWVTTSTEALAEYLRPMTKTPVTCIPDRLNMDYFTSPKQHTEKAREVVWFGYYHNATRVLNAPVFLSLKSRNLRLTVVCNDAFEPQNSLGVEITNIVWDNDSAYLDIQNGDIAINPTTISKGFRFKSNNKTLISWALGVPVANTAEEMDKFMSPQARQEEADKRRKEVEEKWTVEKSIEQYKDIINKCLTQNTKKPK